MTAPQTAAGRFVSMVYGLVGCSGFILFFNLFLERVIALTTCVMRRASSCRWSRPRGDDEESGGRPADVLSIQSVETATSTVIGGEDLSNRRSSEGVARDGSGLVDLTTRGVAEGVAISEKTGSGITPVKLAVLGGVAGGVTSRERRAKRTVYPTGIDSGLIGDAATRENNTVGGVARGVADGSEATANEEPAWEPSIYLVMLVLFLAIVVLGCLSATLYTWIEHWTFGESVYFSFCLFATIGFGDYVPLQRATYTTYINYYRVCNAFIFVLGCSCMHSLFNVISIVIRHMLNACIRRLAARNRRLAMSEARRNRAAAAVASFLVGPLTMSGSRHQQMAKETGDSNGAQQNSVTETNIAPMGDGNNTFNRNSNGLDTEFLNSMGTGNGHANVQPRPHSGMSEDDMATPHRRHSHAPTPGQ